MGKKKQRQGPDIGALAERCAALGCAPRLAIVAHLAANGPTSVNDLGEVAGISVSGVSQHLVKLRAAGAVVGKREAQTIRYELVPGWLEGFVEDLGDIVPSYQAVPVPVVQKVGTAGKQRRNKAIASAARDIATVGNDPSAVLEPPSPEGKRQNSLSSRPDVSRSDDHGLGKGEVATEASDAQEGRPDAETEDGAVGIDDEHDEDGGSGTRYIDDAPEADEVYPEEAAGTRDIREATAYSPHSYGGER